MKRRKPLGWLQGKGLALILIVGAVVYIPLRMALTHWQVPDPQGILILGGDYDRAKAGAELAAQNPQFPLWITGYSFDRLTLEGDFDPLKIAPSRLHYGFCSTDTVTDFTCTVDDLSAHHIRHVYLITSDYHLPRAMAIAWWVLGSRGIIVTPYPVVCQRSQCSSIPETRWRVVRDQLRSMVWILTGRSGASLNPRLASRLNR